MELIKKGINLLKRPQHIVVVIVLCFGIGAFMAASKNIVPPAKVYASAQSLISEKPIQNCSTGLPCMALTFDDGPTPVVTPRVLDILASKHIKASFFLVGKNVAGHENIVKRMVAEGHEIGNHSWSHPDFSKLSPAGVAAEIEAAQKAIVNAGAPVPYLFRPPYGSVNPMVLSNAHMLIARWDIDPNDWQPKDSNKIAEEVITHASPGSVILLHDVQPRTAEALPIIIDKLKTQYRFVTMSELFDLAPGDRGQYFGR